jgi:hypothetical protein
MKVKNGGGGIDAEGNFYTLPETETEVPDDCLEKLHEYFRDAPHSNYVMVPKGFWGIFKKTVRR